jgi:hypothetical protein
MITKHRRFVHHLSCFLSLPLRCGVGMAVRRLGAAVVLQCKALVNHHLRSVYNLLVIS